MHVIVDQLQLTKLALNVRHYLCPNESTDMQNVPIRLYFVFTIVLIFYHLRLPIRIRPIVGGVVASCRAHRFPRVYFANFFQACKTIGMPILICIVLLTLNKCITGRTDMPQVPPLRLVVPRNYPNGNVSVDRAALDLGQ